MCRRSDPAELVVDLRFFSTIVTDKIKPTPSQSAKHVALKLTFLRGDANRRTWSLVAAAAAAPPSCCEANTATSPPAVVSGGPASQLGLLSKLLSVLWLTCTSAPESAHN